MAIQNHAARFRLLPQLAKALNVPTPTVRKPGSAWTELPRPTSAGTEPGGRVRLGYARASMPLLPSRPACTEGRVSPSLALLTARTTTGRAVAGIATDSSIRLVEHHSFSQGGSRGAGWVR
ncbi:hypothetical protein [Streptomyces sp. NBC_00286]|uniref:hypothetical protein n=1 Tax=Streptomyces sp. NBC_00286 TaxID=2975701 RepID=UPI002E2D6231|nr:hypothetical protein [Streptomyces sp. NBC_00286]